MSVFVDRMIGFADSLRRRDGEMGRRRWDEDEGRGEREYGWLILDIIVFFFFLAFLELPLATFPGSLTLHLA